MSVADEENMKLASSGKNSAHDNSAASPASVPGRTTSIQNPGNASPGLGGSSNAQASPVPARDSYLFTPFVAPMYPHHISPANATTNSPPAGLESNTLQAFHEAAYPATHLNPTVNPPHDASHHQDFPLGQPEDVLMRPWQTPAGLESTTLQAFLEAAYPATHFNPTVNPPHDASHHQDFSLGQPEGDPHDVVWRQWQTPTGLESNTPQPFQPVYPTPHLNHVYSSDHHPAGFTYGQAIPVM